ncbi:hypothetical protein, partial [Streptomyces sp. SID13726]|uniref:hypothetical protein n=1 Tax=Streptomyces sp. SID13726 TaxID=2706058 RepID=UPI0013B82BA1
MPARYEGPDADVRWVGTDSTTPAGHYCAVGKDSIGNTWTWLFRGPLPGPGALPDQAAFVGSIAIPDRPGT